MSMIDEMSPASGNVVGSDGKIYNLVTLMGGGEPVSDTVYDVGSFQPRSALILGEDGKVYDLVKLIQSGGSGGDLSEYVKKTDYISANKAGLVSFKGGYGLQLIGNYLLVEGASSTAVKSGESPRSPITPSTQHEAVFYGLAKAAGTDEKSSGLAVGVYTEEAKGAIQKMLGITGGDSLDVQINGASIVKNGIADIPIAALNVLGCIRPNAGIYVHSDGRTNLAAASNKQIDERTPVARPSDNSFLINNSVPLVPNTLDYAVKAALCDGKGAEWNEDEQKAAKKRLGINTTGLSDVTVNGESVVSDGVASIPIVGNKGQGLTLVRLSGDGQLSGVAMYGDSIASSIYTPNLMIVPASKQYISSRLAHCYAPITPGNLDFAVKSALCDGKGEAWAEEECAGARKRLGSENNRFSCLARTVLEEDGVSLMAEFSPCTELYVHAFVPVSEQNTVSKTVSVKLNDSGYVIGSMFGLKYQYRNEFSVKIRVLSDDRIVCSLAMAADTVEFGSWYSGLGATSLEKIIPFNASAGIRRFVLEGEGKSFVLPKGTKLEIYGR